MPSVAEFFIERMINAGIKDVFGLCGDYVLGFYKKLSDSKDINVINTTDENHAGFAADAYARIHGIGAVCVTYNVGALKLANSTACAYAERSPVVIISGSPGMQERSEGVLLHHMVRSFECQKQIFENITCASIVLSNPSTAGYEIDRAFEALKRHRQPIYIELPRDVADKPISYDVYRQGTPTKKVSDPDNLKEALTEVVEWIEKSERPVILAGVQLARFNLRDQLLSFAEKHNIPIASDLLSKSVISENHPLYLGVYAGNTSRPAVRDAVEESDCLLLFGVMVTDMTLAFRPARFEKRQIVSCSVEGLQVKNHTFVNIEFEDFCNALFKHKIEKTLPKSESLCGEKQSFTPTKDKITTKRFFQKIDSILNDKTVVIADIGDSMFGAIDLEVPNRNSFICPAFYTTMGFAIPAALGVQVARKNCRPIVLVGDGAFQMSCTELSTISAHKFNPIIFVINNKGYTTERYLLDGTFNDLSEWEYHKFVDILNNGKGYKVNTEEELEIAIDEALKSKSLSIINVSFDTHDISPALQRMTEGLAKKI